MLYLYHFLKWWVFSANKRTCDEHLFLHRRVHLFLGFAPRVCCRQGRVLLRRQLERQRRVLWDVLSGLLRKAAGPGGLHGAHCGGNTAVYQAAEPGDGGRGKCKSVLWESRLIQYTKFIKVLTRLMFNVLPLAHPISCPLSHTYPFCLSLSPSSLHLIFFLSCSPVCSRKPRSWLPQTTLT